MAENVKQQLLLRVRQSRYYALQADESTDIFVRYELNGKIRSMTSFGGEVKAVGPLS
jgi:hypothetical protein